MPTAGSIIKLLIKPETIILVLCAGGYLAAWLGHWSKSARFVFLLLTITYYAATTRPLAESLALPLEMYHHSSPNPSATSKMPAMVIFASSVEARANDGNWTVIGTRSTDLLLCGLIFIRAGNISQVVLVREPPDEIRV